jgi:hypothetical protein
MSEGKSEIGAAEKLLDILTRLQAATHLYRTEEEYQPHDEAMDACQIELGELLCPSDRALHFDLTALTAQATANAELRAEVAGLRSAINRMAWRMDKRAADAFKSGAVNISKLYEACADIVSEELKGVKP